jgi:hypothetical protein
MDRYGDKKMIKTHYLPVYEPNAVQRQIIGYSVWAYSGHVLLGEIHGTQQYVDTLYQARKLSRQMRDYFNPKEGIT